jgi:alkylhydroperoxidase family enzyme
MISDQFSRLRFARPHLGEEHHMTRIPLVDSNDPNTDPLAAEVLNSVSRNRNRTVNPNVYRAMANHPNALRALVDFGTVVYFENSLTPAQRELAYLTASVTNDCHY